MAKFQTYTSRIGEIPIYFVHNPTADFDVRVVAPVLKKMEDVGAIDDSEARSAAWEDKSSVGLRELCEMNWVSATAFKEGSKCQTLELFQSVHASCRDLEWFTRLKSLSLLQCKMVVDMVR